MNIGFKYDIFKVFMPLVYCSCKKYWLLQWINVVQPMSRYRFSNFWIFFCLTSLSWCLKYIIIRLTPHRPPYRGPGGPKVPKMEKLLTLYWNGIRWKSPRNLSPLTPITWNWPEFPYSWENWEFFANSFSRKF